jgi:hypothetical protein
MLGVYDKSGNLLTADQVLQGIVDTAANAEMARSIGIAVTCFSALAIRDTTIHASGALDVSKLINAKSVVIVHGFDQSVQTVKLTLWNGASSPIPGQIYVNTAAAVTSPAGMVLANSAAPAGNVMVVGSIALLASPFQWLQLEVACSVAPTTGTLTAVCYGSAG